MADSIFSSLLKAQEGFTAIIKKSTNPAFKSKYANLEAVLDAITPALNSNGLFLTQETKRVDNMIEVKTIVFNAAGERFEGGVTCLPIVKNDAQGVGGAITYARRYSLKTMFALAEEDDDGNSASQKPNNTPQPQQKQQAKPQKDKYEIKPEVKEKWRASILHGTHSAKYIIESLERRFLLTDKQREEIYAIEVGLVGEIAQRDLNGGVSHDDIIAGFKNRLCDYFTEDLEALIHSLNPVPVSE